LGSTNNYTTQSLIKIITRFAESIGSATISVRQNYLPFSESFINHIEALT